MLNFRSRCPFRTRHSSELTPPLWRWVRFCVFLVMLLSHLPVVLAQWTEPQVFPVDHGLAIRGPWISNDNLRMYAAFTGYIFVSERAAIDSPWVPFHTVGNWVNSGIRQESPCESPTGDTLYFMSYGRAEPSYGLYDIYYTIRTPEGWFGPIINCGPNINSQYMEWSVGISRDGTKLLVTTDRIPGGVLYLYHSDKQSDSTWGPLTSFGPNVNDWIRYGTAEHPSLSPDNRCVYFCGRGPNNGDVYRSCYSDGWLQAAALPAPINTSQWTEIDPCLASDGRTLYFLSDVDHNNQFQIYTSVDTSIQSARAPRCVQANIAPALFCRANDHGRIDLTVVGLEIGRGASVSVFDVLGRQVCEDHVELHPSDRGLTGRLILSLYLTSGFYVVSLQIGSLTLREQFNIQH